MNCCAYRNVRRWFMSPCDKGSARLEWNLVIFTRLGFVLIISLHLILTSEAFSQGQISKYLGGYIAGRRQLHIYQI